jgi:aryl-alcohol dehydrogenase-like predicted oxidoreductase
MDMPGLGKGLTRAQIERGAEDSLRRLQVERIDLYYAHEDDPNTPLDETLAAFDRLVRDGKVRAIGASNYSAARLKQALEVSRSLGLPRYESLQPLYNLYDRAPYEDELQAVCVEHQVGVINFYGLASGFLTGKYRSEADASKSLRGGSVVKKYVNERGLRILAALDKVAAQTGHTVAQVALAWQMAQPGITAPIASATSVEQLKEMVGATMLHLDAEALETLSTASA